MWQDSSFLLHNIQFLYLFSGLLSQDFDITLTYPKCSLETNEDDKKKRIVKRKRILPSFKIFYRRCSILRCHFQTKCQRRYDKKAWSWIGKLSQQQLYEYMTVYRNR